MKIRNLIYYFSFILILIYSNSKAETILFDSKNIKIEENGNMIFATKGKARIPSNNLIIEGDKFIYNKSISELIVIDDVKYFDSENNIYIESQKIVYNEIENTIFSKNQTFIKSEDTYEINSFDVLYNRNLNKISSNELTTVTDNNRNKFLFEQGLVFKLIDEIISSKKVAVKDKNFNNYFLKIQK